MRDPLRLLCAWAIMSSLGCLESTEPVEPRTTWEPAAPRSGLDAGPVSVPQRDAQANPRPAREPGPRQGNGRAEVEDGGVDATGTSLDPGWSALDTICEELVVGTTNASPELLIVLDRSGSLSGGGWSDATDAVRSLVSALDDSFRVGLMSFPGGDIRGEDGQLHVDGEGSGQCTPGALDVPVRAASAGAIGAALADMQPAGGSPLAQTLRAAADALTNGDPAVPDETTYIPRYVVLVTDGDPTCHEDVPATEQGSSDGQKATIEALQDLARVGVQTYVVGTPTAGSETANALDAMALAGATGDTAYRTLDEHADLLAELGHIGAPLACSFVLAQEVEPARVTVSLDGVEADYGVNWQIAEDARTVELLGPSCTALREGVEVRVEVGCEHPIAI